MNILSLIKNRRSIRKFKKKPVDPEIINLILESGRWAPSGLNNQPWKFMVLSDDRKEAVSKYTKYFSIIHEADKIILIFLDKNVSYNYEKDLMAIGACIQNMLLSIHENGLGACWLGEILNRRKDVQSFLNVSDDLELEAVIALGYPLGIVKKRERKFYEELIIK